MALKIPNAAAPERFALPGLVTEARIMSAINHPNVPDVYELDDERGTLYLAFELVKGTSLKDAIERGIGLTAGLRALIKVLDGLAGAHQRRVVHRDINPVNIIIPDRGPVKIVGFDRAALFDDSAARDGRIVGTPGYMSPEQAEERMLDGRSDCSALVAFSTSSRRAGLPSRRARDRETPGDR